MVNAMLPKTFKGYRRENGRVGIRNHVIILPLDDLSNAASEKVEHNVKGTMALPHHYGRLQFGEDLELHFRTLIGTGANPNVAGVVVIGIEPGWTGRVVDGLDGGSSALTVLRMRRAVPIVPGVLAGVLPAIGRLTAGVLAGVFDTLGGGSRPLSWASSDFAA